MNQKFIVEPYSCSVCQQWDDFVDRARNGTFIHKRRFMDYHADRFEDRSTLVYDEKHILTAIFAANSEGRRIVSHGGLTFGGLIYGMNCRASTVRDILNVLIKYYRKAGFTTLRYKAVPHCFHRYPAEDDLYALFLNDAQLIRRDLSCIIPLNRRLPYSKSRLGAIKKGRKADLRVMQNGIIEDFHSILSGVLRRHGTSPVHSASEMRILQERFPDLIRLFTVADSRGYILAGAWTFQFGSVLHFQYLANTEEGRAKGALDLLIAEIIENGPVGLTAISFGGSTEKNGRYLNEGLMFQKEGFGARGVVLDQYEVNICE